VTTTGPATIDSATGKPYAMSFPIVTMRDFVQVQKALLDSLGVSRLHAAIGASGGSFQTIDWAAAYPDFVARIVPVISSGEADAWIIEKVELWAQAIRLDPNWNNGDYYGKTEPTAGLALALKLVTLDARHWGWADKTFGRKLATEGASPLNDWNNKYAVVQALDAAGVARARTVDANHFLYLVRANQLYVAGHASGGLEAGLAMIKAKALFLPAKSDLLVPPDNARKAVEILRKQGKSAELVEIDGDGGHLDGVLAVARVGDNLRRFLAQ
jgi:homoserine O-acetyltransferase